MTRVPASVQDFPALIQWLMDTYDDGVPFHMAARLTVNHATVHKWLHGMVKQPSLRLVTLLSEVYRIERDQITELALRSPAKPVPITPRRRSPKKPLPIAGGSGQAQPLSTVSEVADNKAHYVKRRLAIHRAPMPIHWSQSKAA